MFCHDLHISFISQAVSAFKFVYACIFSSLDCHGIFYLGDTWKAGRNDDNSIRFRMSGSGRRKDIENYIQREPGEERYGGKCKSLRRLNGVRGTVNRVFAPHVTE
jgi:hypothetical protein